ncbi:hypothetical protein IMCC14465_12670 [alpha proteobacterium IMCC14465]|uniref:Uncharacterized protein n=1 Tax=alpha proteobacterium IMCC14465 TaxID=1220535 RepID=J9DHT7_9PROT|nr:hypothetical protein IMCC14465_12670 [alpha proteobacterium IMCC14465]
MAGCAFDAKYPDTPFRYNDENLTCSDIEFEATEIQKRAERMIAEDAAIPEDEKKKSTGVMFVPLWFVLDLTDPLNVHLRAMEARTKVLKRLADKKECDLTFQPPPKP